MEFMGGVDSGSNAENIIRNDPNHPNIFGSHQSATTSPYFVQSTLDQKEGQLGSSAPPPNELLRKRSQSTQLKSPVLPKALKSEDGRPPSPDCSATNATHAPLARKEAVPESPRRTLVHGTPPAAESRDPNPVASRCLVCGCSLAQMSLLEREVHVNECLDGCPVCKIPMGTMTILERELHVNRCLTPIPCPVCQTGLQMLPLELREDHVKDCMRQLKLLEKHSQRVSSEQPRLSGDVNSPATWPPQSGISPESTASPVIESPNANASVETSTSDTNSPHVRNSFEIRCPICSKDISKTKLKMRVSHIKYCSKLKAQQKNSSSDTATKPVTTIPTTTTTKFDSIDSPNIPCSTAPGTPCADRLDTVNIQSGSNPGSPQTPHQESFSHLLNTEAKNQWKSLLKGSNVRFKKGTSKTKDNCEVARALAGGKRGSRWDQQRYGDCPAYKRIKGIELVMLVNQSLVFGSFSCTSQIIRPTYRHQYHRGWVSVQQSC